MHPWRDSLYPQQRQLPVDVIAAIATFAILWIVLFGLRRASFVLLVLVASVGMVVLTAMRTPREQDLAMAHHGLVVLGFVSAAALFAAFVILGPIARRIGPLRDGLVEAFNRPGATRGLALALVVLVGAFAEEVFWRGFVHGRLSEMYDPARAFRLTLAGYTGAHLLTFNLALAAAALLCGGVWGFIRVRTGTLVPSVVSHVAFSVSMWLLYPV